VRGAWPGSTLDFDRPSRLLRDLCRREGIPVLDLGPVFRERAARGESMFQGVDGHWGPAGQRVAAGAIARAAEGRWAR
jgi:hypothetical protein